MRPRSRLPFVLVMLVGVATAGCVTPPRGHAASRLGSVSAPGQEQAVATAESVDDLVPRLLGLDAGLRAMAVDIVLSTETAGGDIYGGFEPISRRITLQIPRPHAEATLAHELVHAMEPDAWAALPAVVREGLADHLASRAVPAVAREMRQHRSIALALYAARADAPEPLEALAVAQGQLRTLGDGDTLRALYGMGLLIVERAGVDALVRLSQDAQRPGGALVAAEQILAAARLPHARADWLPIIAAWPASGAPEQTEPDDADAVVRD